MKYRIKRFFSNTLEEIKENIISKIPTKEVIITETSKKILESLENNKKNRKESREEVEYEDRPIRRNNIVIRKPSIKYRRENVEETPEMISRSVMEFPEEKED